MDMPCDMIDVRFLIAESMELMDEPLDGEWVTKSMNSWNVAQSVTCLGARGHEDAVVEWSSSTAGVWSEERSDDRFSMW